MPALEFVLLDSSIDSTTQGISSTLRLLVANASARVTTLYQLNRLRIDRQRVLDLEEVVQSRNAEMLAEAKRELERQDRWEVEIREVLARAEEAGEPIDLKEVDEVVQSLGQMDELQVGSVAKLQAAYLTSSFASSQRRLKSLVSKLKASSASSLTASELLRLHRRADAVTAELEELTRVRSGCMKELGRLEGQRRKVEERRGEVVLELVLRWDAGRKEAREGLRGR